MKQAIQLQFDFGQEATAAAPSPAALDRIEHRALTGMSALIAAARPYVGLTAAAFLSLAFGFSLMFIAAIIGG